MTARILRLAGPRATPSADRAARVQQAVRREWRAARRRRIVHRTVVGGMVGLAAVATLVVAVRLRTTRPVPSPAGLVLAVAEHTQGSPQVRYEQDGRERLRPLSTTVAVHPGEIVETGADRAALQTSDGSSVRIDHDSRVRFLAPAIIEVTAGAAYVATAPGSVGFEVRTPMGTVHDFGTQFEVRVSNASLRLRVRAGAVELRRGGTVTPAAAGTEATATAGGIALRQVATYGDEWSWTSEVAPPFAIDGQPLSSFLAHLASEEGWQLTYGDSQLAENARQIILHGSVDGLKPEEALAATLATSGLHYRLSEGVLVLSR